MITNYRLSVWSNKPLGAFFNILRTVYERRNRVAEVKGMPFVLYYEPTTYCNLKCPACPTGVGLLDRPKSKADFNEFKATVDALGDYIFELVMYNWGEPLLHRDFPKMVRYATDKGILVNASTNLSMPLSPERCEEIIRSGLSGIKVGIDGATPEVHAMYRRGSDLELVHRNLRMLLQKRKELGSATPTIYARYHVFSHNEGEIDLFRQQMAEIGVDGHTIGPAWLPPDGSVTKAKHPKFDMYDEVNTAIAELRGQGQNLKPCSWLHYTAVMNPSGSISPCCGIVSEKSDFGRVVSDGHSESFANQFKAVWNGQKYVASRKLFSQSNVTKWATKNLIDLEPDGMAFSTASGPAMICAKCPIPHTLEQWEDSITRIYTSYLSATLRSLRSFDLRGFFRLSIRSVLLRVALQIQ